MTLTVLPRVSDLTRQLVAGHVTLGVVSPGLESWRILSMFEGSCTQLFRNVWLISAILVHLDDCSSNSYKF